MADYHQLKVTELKDELKRRSIPTTNLTRKQQIVDRLLQDDDEKNETADAQSDSQDQKNSTPEADVALTTAEEPETIPSEGHHMGDAVPEPSEGAASTADASEPIEPIEPTQDTPVVAPQEQTIHEMPAEQASENKTLAEQPSDDDNNNNTPVEHRSDDNNNTPVKHQSDNNNNTPVKHQSDNNTPVEQPSDNNTPALHNDTEETTPDTRKRKRRSLTPALSEASVNKKLKGNPLATEDTQVAMSDVPLDAPDATVQPMASSDDVMDITSNHAPDTAINHTQSNRDSGAPSSKHMRSPNQRRFKDIINPSASAPNDPTNPQPPADDEPDVSPALHPATRALYIRHLVRPISLEALREHLEQLATPPGHSTSADLVQDCYVDTLRTHAFVLFTSITAASRARASLHSRVWPPEPQRKPLWVDFIPEDRMTPWIEQERASGGTRASTAKRWEIVYHLLDDGLELHLTEAPPLGPGGQHQHHHHQQQQQPPSSFAQGMPGAPSGPRNPTGQPRRPSFSQETDRFRRRPSQPSHPPPPAAARPTQKALAETSASFLELDKLFKFTATKPKLYYQPVSASLADKRLDELDAETSRDWDPREDARLNGDGLGRGLDALKRYTFEDGDVLVDGGPEYGGGAAFARGGGGGGGGGGGVGRRRGGGGGGGGGRYR